MGNIEVTVEAITPERLPQTVRYRFPDDIQSAHWRFFAWRDDGVHAVDMPPVGQSLEIPAYDIGKVVMYYASKKS